MENIAIFAGGCFWGVEHFLQQKEGVKSVESGYIGGEIPSPTYQQVKSKLSGHAEAVRVVFDASVISYEDLAKAFFEIHDFTQVDGQGYDLGPQYRTEIFYLDNHQKEVAEALIQQLTEKGYKVATKVTAATEFYSAEDYHQDYFERNGGEPDCHVYRKVF